jgi:hypothetical protein
MVDSSVGVLVVNMARLIIYECLLLRTILGVLRNTTATKITLRASGEIAARALDMDISK